MLTKLGHRVDTVGNGAETVAAVREIHYRRSASPASSP
jgi:hypothetical protein